MPLDEPNFGVSEAKPLPLRFDERRACRVLQSGKQLPIRGIQLSVEKGGKRLSRPCRGAATIGICQLLFEWCGTAFEGSRSVRRVGVINCKGTSGEGYQPEQRHGLQQHEAYDVFTSAHRAWVAYTSCR